MSMSIFKLIVSLFLILPAVSFAEEGAAAGGAGSVIKEGFDTVKNEAASAFNDFKKMLSGAFEADPKEKMSNCNMAGEGVAVCEEIHKITEDLLFETAPNGFPLIDQKSSALINTALQSYQSSVKSCHSHQLRASKVCLSSENRELQDAMTAITVFSSAGGASANQACSSAGKALGLASAALTAYQSACAAAKSICLPSCSKANTALKSLQKSVGAVKLNTDVAADPKANVAAAQAKLNAIQSKIYNLVQKDLVPADKSSTAGKLDVCSNKYGQLLLSAATGVTGVMNAKKSADACAGNTSGVASMNLDQKCKMTEYSNTQECICHLSPRTPGCANSLDKIGSDSSQGISIGGAGQVDTQNKSPGLGGSDLRGPSGADINEKVGSGNNASAGGMPSAGGLGSSTAGGGGGAGGSGDSSAAFPGTYSYDDSGSGGGGGWGGGGGGAWGADGLSTGDGLEAYLPEGEKDPNALSALSDEPTYVTPEGGKTNFEKVRQIYGEVRSTLLDK